MLILKITNLRKLNLLWMVRNLEMQRKILFNAIKIRISMFILKIIHCPHMDILLESRQFGEDFLNTHVYMDRTTFLVGSVVQWIVIICWWVSIIYPVKYARCVNQSMAKNWHISDSWIKLRDRTILNGSAAVQNAKWVICRHAGIPPVLSAQHQSWFLTKSITQTPIKLEPFK